MKKSAPRIGRRTSAIQKVCEIRCPEEKERLMSLGPYVAISEPLAATKDWVLGSVWSREVAGNKLSSAPESTRKYLREA